MKKAIKEHQLIFPTLAILSAHTGYISIKTIKVALAKELNLYVRDNDKYSGRNTTRFENTVGNLISHNTLDAWVKYGTDAKNHTTMKITANGRHYLMNSILHLKAVKA